MFFNFRITKILPELKEECAAKMDMKALTDKDEEIMQTFSKVSELSTVKINKTVKIGDYPYVLKKLIESKGLSVETIIQVN